MSPSRASAPAGVLPLLRSAFAAYRSQLGALAVVTLGTGIVTWLVGALGALGLEALSGTPYPTEYLFQYAWRALTGSVVLAAAGTTASIVVQDSRGQPVGAAEALKKALPLIGPMLLLTLLGAVLLAGPGFSLTKLPWDKSIQDIIDQALGPVLYPDVFGGRVTSDMDAGVIEFGLAISPLLAVWSLSPVVLVAEGGSVFRSLRRSWALTAGGRLRLWAASVLAMAVGAIPSLLAWQLRLYPLLGRGGRLLADVLVALMVSLWACVLAVYYLGAAAAGAPVAASRGGRMPAAGQPPAIPSVARPPVGAGAVAAPPAASEPGLARPLLADPWFQLLLLVAVVSGALIFYNEFTRSAYGLF